MTFAAVAVQKIPFKPKTPTTYFAYTYKRKRNLAQPQKSSYKKNMSQTKGSRGKSM